MEIIRNCTHYSSTMTAIDYDAFAKPSKVVKVSFDEDGARALRNEYEGIKWYARQLSVDPASVASIVGYTQSYVRLELVYKHGELGDPYKSIKENYKKVLSAIDYNLKVFGKSGPRFSHGDYSLSNMIFRNDEVIWVIDWEQFNQSLPPEFDILNCIMEACYFNYMKRKKLKSDEVVFFRNLLNHASSIIGLPESCLTAPANYFSNLCLNNAQVLGSQAMKFPFVNHDPNDIKNIDSYFGQRGSKS